MTQPEALDLCSGQGGTALGLIRAGFKVTGVDKVDHGARYPGTFVQADALDYLEQHGHRFPVVVAGFPCQPYSRATCGNLAARAKYDRLIAAGREALQAHGGVYMIENVEQAKAELRDPLLLCGRMFGLEAVDEDGMPLVLDRHRLFESNVPLTAPPHPAHGPEQVAGVYGGARRAKRPLIGATPAPWQDRHAARHDRQGGYVPRSKRVKQDLLGIDWMTVRGMEESIPPVYAEHLGRQLMEALVST